MINVCRSLAGPISHNAHTVLLSTKGKYHNDENDDNDDGVEDEDDEEEEEEKKEEEDDNDDDGDSRTSHKQLMRPVVKIYSLT